MNPEAEVAESYKNMSSLTRGFITDANISDHLLEPLSVSSFDDSVIRKHGNASLLRAPSKDLTLRSPGCLALMC